MSQAAIQFPNLPTPSRRAIVEEAREWIGTPYAHLQRTKGRFSDCVGLVIGVARKFGLGDYTREDYSQIPDPVQMERNLNAQLDPIDPARARPGDILWFAIVEPSTRQRMPRHVGIVSDYRYGGLGLIHAYAEIGKVSEHALTPKWRKRICGAFSYRGVID